MSIEEKSLEIIEPEKKEKQPVPRWLIADLVLLAVAVVSLILYYTLRAVPGFADMVSESFSYPVRDFIGSVMQYVPFSMAEWFYVAVIVFVLIHIVYSIIKIKKSGKRWWEFLKRAFVLLLVVLYILSCYNWLWGIDYYGTTFSQQSGIPSNSRITPQELFNVTVAFLVTANELSTQVARDEDGNFAEDIDEVFDRAPQVYENMFEVFPFLEGECRRPKKMVFSDIMSYIGFTGLYFPFTGESNINMSNPACLIPSTVSHELAHQLGYTSEQECNFIGIVAGISSGDVVYQYSSCLSGLIYLMNALYSTDIEAWRYLKENFTEELRCDWEANNVYWNDKETMLEQISSLVYDFYLKSNGQTMGILSYSACVTMLVEYFK